MLLRGSAVADELAVERQAGIAKTGLKSVLKSKYHSHHQDGVGQGVPSWSLAQGNVVDRCYQVLSMSTRLRESVYDGHVMAMPSYPIPAANQNLIFDRFSKLALEPQMCS